MNITRCWLLVAGIVAIAGCGGADGTPFGGGAQPGTGGAVATGGIAPVATGGAIPATGTGGRAAGGADGVVAVGGSAGTTSTGGAAGGPAIAGAGGNPATGTGGAAGSAGAGGAAPKKTCLRDADCGDPWTTSCVAHAENIPSTCEVTCDPPCGPGTECAGGNTCKVGDSTYYILADQRTCEASCDRATSVCLTNGTKTWTCTPLCTSTNTITGAPGCLPGYHCINSNTADANYAGTGACLQDGGEGEACGVNNFCIYGTCNAATRLCPYEQGRSCTTGADCITGTCNPNASGGMSCS